MILVEFSIRGKKKLLDKVQHWGHGRGGYLEGFLVS